MTWVVPLALVGFAVLLMTVFTMVSARRKHHAAVMPAPVGGPRILVHDINDDRCTGCDACVAVCPTNVLDLVANKSRVLRFEDCIQCEACMFACPTEALVMFPQGATPPPLKVPEMDENFQTMVPGQYLIGEVAGKPLVKNAANLGRAVIEHMLLTGMQPGAMGNVPGSVDVAIVGSGPGGLSAALSCIQRGLSYVVLEKEQMIASTILRYPKGKLVMAEPYDTVNLSMLPVFDAAKEQLIPIWQELMQRLGLRVNQGEAVETIGRGPDGAFEVRSTVGAYRAQRVVLSIGTRGKPRTLQVPGENLPKIFSLLEDPDEHRGKSVLVVGGGDSACEAALAMADAGAKVMISYRGKSFNRAAPKNKAAIEAYAAEGRLKAKLGSQVLQFDPESVTLALGDGSQKRYANDAAFVLIGSDPPVQWLEKMGVKFVERPHQYQMGKTDDIVRRFVRAPMECPEDAARAAAQILGGSTGIEPEFPLPQVPGMGPPDMPIAAQMVGFAGGPGPEEVKGPRKWLRSATSIFSNRNGTQNNIPMPPPTSSGAKKLAQPMPLSEFAKRGRDQSTGAGARMTGQQTGVRSGNNGTGVHHMHTGHGRRDQLSAGERTRILRMLRDEGGRIADEDSEVYIGAAPSGQQGQPSRGAPMVPEFDFDFDAPDSQRVPPPVALRPDVPAKPAVVVGLSQAQQQRRQKKQTAAPPPPPANAFAPVHLPVTPPVVPYSLRTDEGSAPLHLPDSPAPIPTREAREQKSQLMRARNESQVPPPLREIEGNTAPSQHRGRATQSPPPSESPSMRSKQASQAPMQLRDSPVRAPDPFGDNPSVSVSRRGRPNTVSRQPGSVSTAMPVPAAPAPARATPNKRELPKPFGSPFDVEPTRMATVDPRDFDKLGLEDLSDTGASPIPPSKPPVTLPREPEESEATSVASLDAIAAMERARKHGNDDSTRAINIGKDVRGGDVKNDGRNDNSMSDVDWDLD